MILNINEGGSDNLGDQAISESLTSILHDNEFNSDTYNFTKIEVVNKTKENGISNKIFSKSLN